MEDFRKDMEQILIQKTGRRDIEVTVGPYRSYDVSVSEGADGHPIVDFYSAMRWDPIRVGAALNYAIEMLQNWEANKVVFDKAIKDSERFFEVLKAQFPDMELKYKVVDSDTHFVRVKRVEGKLVAIFDLWPKMTDADVEQIANYIRHHRRVVETEGATMSGVDY